MVGSAGCFVSAIRIQLRDVFEEQDLEVLGQCEVIRRAERLLAEFGEAEAGTAMGGLRHVQLAAQHVDVEGLAPFRVGEALPQVLQAGIGLG